MSSPFSLVEILESRRLLSVGYTPAQIRTAYGFDQITFDNGTVQGNGAGQTIAVIEVDNDTTLNTDLDNFDAAYGLSNSGAGWSLSVIGQGGGAPPTSNTVGVESYETALDVEWAHAIAPAANILVVEANSSDNDDLNAAASYAATVKGVSAVSMSYTSVDSGLEGDLFYTTPANHSGVTFVAAAGDSAEVYHPASAATVLGVGGTSLTLGSGNTYLSETTWSGTGGGTSAYQAEPAYQYNVQDTGLRMTPDVAYDADPNTGFDIYVNGVDSPFVVGGTSAGAPQWAALIAIADQGRVLNGLGSLDGATQTLPMLYDLYGTPLYASAFHDITTGGNGVFFAGPGYDEVTGLGSPQANVLVQYLAGNISLPEPATFAIALALTPLLLRRPRR
ncbi:MAG TPA: S53 family peptidase [Tepidisphaeraceae bacterium]|jgi:subtilase family serine protease|nr:S53 family peptidase [Tepidisphaeraceae bacterium]